MESNEHNLSNRYENAISAYFNGQVDHALTAFEDLVVLQYAPAASYLAQLYLRGENVPNDRNRAVELFTLAASLGDGNAAFNLGAMYRNGAFGVSKDSEKSKKCFLLARQLGCELSVNDYV